MGKIVTSSTNGWWTFELKCMYVRSESRGRVCRHQLLKALEVDAIVHGCPGLLLETGPSQPEAISFYEKHGFQR